MMVRGKKLSFSGTVVVVLVIIALLTFKLANFFRPLSIYDLSKQ